MENPNMGMPAAQPKKSNNTVLIIVVVVGLLLCCCCLIAAGGGYYYVQNQVSDVYSSINEQLTALPENLPELPGMTAEPSTNDGSSDSAPSATEVPLDLNLPADAIPQGGLGDDVLRANTWAYAVMTVVTSGCNVPVAKDTQIEVLQDPDANGEWKERWTVACEGADPVAVDIVFTPSSSSGMTDIKVTLSK